MIILIDFIAVCIGFALGHYLAKATIWLRDRHKK